MALGFSPFHTPWPPSHRDARKLLAPEIKVIGDRQRILTGFETAAAANTERRLQINRLRRSTVPGADRLADKLESCRQGRRCLSGACPVCVGRTRIWLIAEMLRHWPIHGGGTKARARSNCSHSALMAITLIRKTWIYPAGSLYQAEPKKLIDEVRHQFHRNGAGDAVVIGGLHGDFNAEDNYWQLHIHIIVSGANERTLNQLRKKHYQRTRQVYRPMKVDPVNDPVRQFSYVLKSYWPQKVRFIGRSNRMSGSKRRLDEPHHTEHLMWLDQFGLLDLLLLVGVRRYGNELRRVAR